MGCEWSCETHMGTPAWRKADAIFDTHWETYYTFRKAVKVCVPLDIPWDHMAAQRWTEQHAGIIKSDMETKEIDSSYNCKVELTLTTGKIYLVCRSNEDTKISFQLEITYERKKK